MTKMEIFEPAMCCSTGVCGTSADPELLRVAAVIDNLKRAGIDVARYNLSSDPKEFMQYQAISNALYSHGEEALPITVINGKIVKSGGYPTNEEFAKWLGISVDEIKPAVKVKINKCGCGSKGCCQ